jgi:hypothetical protein
MERDIADAIADIEAVLTEAFVFEDDIYDHENGPRSTSGRRRDIRARLADEIWCLTAAA